ncbi:MAG TPA: SRPBCC family protein, partial [Microthrixaceae bacterium]|nr:SRPBCC family protein [Microthrixaceae bacterium]
MDVTATLAADVPIDALFEVVADLGTYPEWLDIVGRAEPLDPATGADGTAEDAAWSVDLKGQVGPFRRSKRLRMVRASFDDPDATGRASVRFERRELDGRSHSDWVLSAELSTPAG